MAARAVGGALIAGVVTLLLALVVENAPSLATLLSGLCLVALLVALARIVRSQERRRKAAVFACALGGSVAAIALANALVVDDVTEPVVTAGVVTSEQLAVEDGADCSCPPAQDIVGVGVSREGADTIVRVRFAAEPVDDATLFVWRIGAPAGPVQLARRGGQWSAPSDPWSSAPEVVQAGSEVAVRVHEVDAPIAVVSRGDRAPDIGHVDASGQRVTSGVGADIVEAAVARVQAGFGTLDVNQQALASSLLSRQYKTATTVFRITAPGGASSGETTVTVSYPQLSQITVDPTGSAAVYALVDGVSSCAVRGNGPPTCQPLTTVNLPATVAATMATEPTQVRVTPRPDLEQSRLHCVSVVSVAPGGPTPGVSCWRNDGTLESSSRDDGVTLELIDASPEIDVTRLQKPSR